MCPAIKKLAKWFIIENQVQRKNGETGFLDFRINYNNYLIALEVKTAHLSIKGKTIRKTDDLFTDIEKALNQLDGLSLGKYDFLLKNNSKGLIKIVLVSIVFSGKAKSIELRNNQILTLKDNTDVNEKLKLFLK